MNRRGVLVSVRDAGEASAALAGGAAVIDVKDPAAGSLGAAAAETIAAVAEVVGAHAPWSMAAGEVAAGVESILELVARVCDLLPAGAARPTAVKAGLAGMVGDDWPAALVRLGDGLPPGVVHVAVAYADFDRARAPAPPDVIEAAARLGCGMLLIDTADKRGPGLLGLGRRQAIAGWVAAARARGLGVAVAGKIRLEEIPQVSAWDPDLVALRSAVCSNHGVGDPRLGCVSVGLVAAAVAAAGPIAAGCVP